MVKTNFDIFMIIERYVVSVQINIKERTVSCTMITSSFAPITFYSENFSKDVVDYLSVIFTETQRFIPQFYQLEKEYLNKKNT